MNDKIEVHYIGFTEYPCEPNLNEIKLKLELERLKEINKSMLDNSISTEKNCGNEEDDATKVFEDILANNATLSKETINSLSPKDRISLELKAGMGSESLDYSLLSRIPQLDICDPQKVDSAPIPYLCLIKDVWKSYQIWQKLQLTNGEIGYKLLGSNVIYTAPSTKTFTQRDAIAYCAQKGLMLTEESSSEKKAGEFALSYIENFGSRNVINFDGKTFWSSTFTSESDSSMGQYYDGNKRRLFAGYFGDSNVERFAICRSKASKY